MHTYPNTLNQSKPLPASAVLRHSRGLTLLEILIALVVLSIGLLGLANLQLFGLASTNDSAQRSMVSFITNDLADRMRINRIAALNGAYDDLDSDDYFSSDRTSPSGLPTLPNSVGNCQTASCTPAQIAILDQRTWLDHFVKVNNTDGWTPVVDAARGQVTRSGTRVRIEVSWIHSQAGWDSTTNKRISTVASPSFDLEFDL